MTFSSEEQYHELSFYTLAHKDKSFIHQHIVDAYIAQTANQNTKAISLVFSLAGLYLYVEKNYTGRQVQQFHLQMAKNKIAWPSINLPEYRGNISVANVIEEPPGPQRDDMIHKWCISVWDAYKDNSEVIAALLQTGIVF